jgi:hypothetical protein
LSPQPANVAAVVLSGALAWSGTSLLLPLVLIFATIFTAAVKYSFIAAVLLFVLIALPWLHRPWLCRPPVARASTLPLPLPCVPFLPHVRRPSTPIRTLYTPPPRPRPPPPPTPHLHAASPTAHPSSASPGPTQRRRVDEAAIPIRVNVAATPLPPPFVDFASTSGRRCHLPHRPWTGPWIPPSPWTSPVDSASSWMPPPPSSPS